MTPYGFTLEMFNGLIRGIKRTDREMLNLLPQLENGNHEQLINPKHTDAHFTQTFSHHSVERAEECLCIPQQGEEEAFSFSTFKSFSIKSDIRTSCS